MDNKKNLKVFEGLPVKADRRQQEAFDEAKSLVANGEAISVFLNVIKGTEPSIAVTRTIKKDGKLANFMPIGRVTNKDAVAILGEDVCKELRELIENGSCTGEITNIAPNGTMLEMTVREVEVQKDLSTGFNPDEAIKRAEKIFGKDSLNERLEWLETHGLKKTEFLYSVAIGMMVDGPIQERPKILYQYTGTPVVRDFLANLASGNYPVLQGPKSVGKNVVIESLVKWFLNCNIVTLQSTEGLTVPDMVGYPMTDPTVKKSLTLEGLKAMLEAEKTGNWSDEALIYRLALDKSNSPDLVFSRGPVVEAMERANAGEGIVLVVDEMNLSDPNVLAGVFNTLCDHHSKELFVTGYGYVPVPQKNFFICATQNANTASESYSGINSQNVATMSRFSCIDIPETKDIKKILMPTAKEYNVSETIVDGINTVYKEFRALAEKEDGVSSNALNIRGLESALRLIAFGSSFKSAIMMGVINIIPSVEERITLEEIIDGKVDGKGNYIIN